MLQQPRHWNPPHDNFDTDNLHILKWHTDDEVVCAVCNLVVVADKQVLEEVEVGIAVVPASLAVCGSYRRA